MPKPRGVKKGLRVKLADTHPGAKRKRAPDVAPAQQHHQQQRTSKPAKRHKGTPGGGASGHHDGRDPAGHHPQQHPQQQHPRGQQWQANSIIDRQAAQAVDRLIAAAETQRSGATIKALTLAPHVVHKRATHAVTCETLRCEFQCWVRRAVHARVCVGT